MSDLLSAALSACEQASRADQAARGAKNYRDRWLALVERDAAEHRVRDLLASMPREEFDAYVRRLP